jgi:AcrR family transcriptional regulator
MTDLVRRAGKRERLIASAKKLIHEQGVHPTTLSDVAAAADVPPGNVYYYFKTKEDLVRAVVEAYIVDADTMLADLDRLRSPQARLKGLTRGWLDVADTVAEHGCPVGSLCAERNNATARSVVRAPKSSAGSPTGPRSSSAGWAAETPATSPSRCCPASKARRCSPTPSATPASWPARPGTWRSGSTQRDRDPGGVTPSRQAGVNRAVA